MANNQDIPTLTIIEILQMPRAELMKALRERGLLPLSIDSDDDLRDALLGWEQYGRPS